MTNDSPPRRLRVALIAEHVHRRGGQERVTAELVTRLSRRHEVSVYCYSAEGLPAEVTVHRLWRPGRSATLQALLIPLLSSLLVRPRDYDVVMSQGGNAFRQNFVLVHTCHAARRRAAARPHPQQPRESRPWRFLQYLRNLWASAMEARAVRRCAGRVIAVSPALARALAAEHGVRREEILIAPNGVDHDLFNPIRCAAVREEMRRELGLADKEFVILFVGGMWPEKGLPLLVWALARLDLPARLVVVGKGDQAALAALAEEAGVADRLLVVGPQPDVHRYYAAADCFAFPSEAEGFGLVLAEAAACGLPLVATPVGIAPELIEDGVSGYLVTADPGQIAQRLEVLARDPALRLQMGREAHRRALPLTWDSQAERIERFFLERAGWARLPGGTGDPSALLGALSSSKRTPPPSEGPRLRVAVISHSCVVDVNQRLYADLARAYPDVELLLVAPEFWWNRLSGGRTFSVLPETAAFAQALPVRLSGQMHLHWYPRRRLGRLLEAFRPEVLLLDEEPYSVVGFEGASLGRALGARVLLYTKQNLLRGYPPPFSWLQSWVLRNVDGMLAVSPECEQVLRQRGYRGPVQLLPHGVDTGAFSPGPAEELRRQLGLQGTVIGYAGRLEGRKGVLDLLEAARLLRQGRGYDFSLLVVGDGPLRGRMEDFTTAHLAPGQARHLGFVSHHDMPNYIRALDILTLPSRTTPHWKEQFGRVLLEALACGVPVVGSDSGYIPELIKETGGGLVFREGDAEALAERLGWMLAHPEQRREMGKHGREVVQREYSSQRVAERLHRALMNDE
jgi:glycosyltransferase involved in cell wall biosynthesis